MQDQPERQPPRIAVVNEDTLFLTLMEELLALEGYTTYVLRASNAAYREVRELMPDLVILDVRLNNPEAGWTVLDLIRLDPATHHIPVIICSTDARMLREKEAHLRELNCGTLEKPFDLDYLLAMVASFVGPGNANQEPGAASREQ